MAYRQQLIREGLITAADHLQQIVPLLARVCLPADATAG
jgi:hypothetical protein